MVWTGRVNKRVAQVSGVRKGGRSKSSKLAVATKRAQALFLWAFQGRGGDCVDPDRCMQSVNVSDPVCRRYFA